MSHTKKKKFHKNTLFWKMCPFISLSNITHALAHVHTTSTHTHTHTPTLSLSLSHTHTHTHAYTQIHTHEHTWTHTWTFGIVRVFLSRRMRVSFFMGHGHVTRLVRHPVAFRLHTSYQNVLENRIFENFHRKGYDRIDRDNYYCSSKVSMTVLIVVKLVWLY